MHGRRHMFTPVDRTSALYCSVAEGYRVSWYFERYNSPFYNISNLQQLQRVQEHYDVSIAYLNPRSSRLRVHVVADLNRTIISCVATNLSDILTSQISPVKIIIHGKYEQTVSIS